MNQVLSKAEILALVNKTRDSNYFARWPSVKDKEKILAALKAKDERVELDSGTFTIIYSEGVPWKTNGGENHSTAFLKRADSTEFVPCGYFSEKELMRELLGEK